MDTAGPAGVAAAGYRRDVEATSGYLSSNPPRVHFGFPGLPPTLVEQRTIPQGRKEFPHREHFDAIDGPGR